MRSPQTEEVIKSMKLGDKTHEFLHAAESQETTPEQMRSIIAGLRTDSDLVHTGAVLPMLQLALQVALEPSNDAESERRLGVIKAIADALAEECGGDYVRDVLEQSVSRGNPESIVKIID